MMSHQAGNAIASIDPAQKAGTVERMKSGVGHCRSVPDVVQPSRGYQGTIGQTKSLSNMLRPVPNTLHMPPPARQSGQVPLGENPRISGRNHDLEPMRSPHTGLDQRICTGCDHKHYCPLVNQVGYGLPPLAPSPVGRPCLSAALAILRPIDEAR
jgi:hypothetical protein